MGRICGIGVLVFYLFTGEVFASHAVSADISYRCLGGNNYRFTLNFYRDCNGANAPGSPSINFRSTSCNYNFSRTLTLQSSQEVQMLCPGQQPNSTCNGGTLPGIQQYVYARTITLPGNCSDWVISYDLCCRNAAITNLFDPGNQDMYIETRLNNTGGLCNNSPVFTTLPVPYICSSQQVSYNHGATDADGDSLVYTSINPLDNPSSNIPYTGAYNPNHPLSLTGGFTLNQQTGQMLFTPSSSQNAVITVRVQEYRNGVLIGSTMRDMQFVIIACSNTLPTASGVNGTSGYTTTFCTGRSNCFNITTADVNAAQSLTLTWSNAIPGASFNSNGASRPTGTFCWNPGIASVGSHTFLATVQDNACPLFGSNVYAYTINVEEAITVNLNATAIACNGNSNATATATVTGGSGSYTYAWNTTPVQTTPTATGLSAGTYIVTVTDASLSPQCGVVLDTIQITQPTAITVTHTRTHTSCGLNNGSISLGVSGGTGPYQYLWSNGSTSNARTGLAAGTYPYTVTDNAGCSVTSSSTVNASSAPVLNVGTTNITCNGFANGTANVSVTGGLTPYSFLWSGGSTAQNRNNLTAGTHTVTVTDAASCTDEETITITQPAAIPNTVLPVQICAGQSHFAGGAPRTSTGTYYDTLTSAGGCDSVIETHLTVLTLASFQQAFSVCNGDGIAVGSSFYTTTGTYYDTFPAANGCDSIVQTQLTVYNNNFEVQNRAVCQGDNITIGSSVYSAAGTYYDTLANNNGCDSVIQTNLTVMPEYFENVSAAICNGDSFVVGSSVYTSAGTYYDTLAASTGCDSVVFTTITVLNHSFIAIDTAICFGESVTIGASLYSTAGIYTDTFISANGCDSVVQTALTVLPIQNVVLNPAICAGQTFVVGSSTYNTTGTYSDTLESAVGCDSIIQTNLIVFSTHFQIQNRTICFGDVALVGSSSYSVAGTYLDTLTNNNGCDSIIQTNLVVQPDYYEALTPTICDGNSFMVGSSVYTTSGNYYDTLAASTGCDSVVFTTLTVLNNAFTAIDTAICSGENLIVGSSVYTVAGVYTDTFAASNGCDSVVQTTLAVLPILNTTLNPSICAGDVFVTGSSTYNSTGSYFDTLQSALGCDSIIQTNLIVLDTQFQVQNRTICFGDSIVTGSSTYFSAGTYFDTLLNGNGCDSTIQTNLVVLPQVVEVVTPTICDGQSFTVGASVYTLTGSYADTLAANTGCDSIIFTTLTVLNNAFTSIDTAICFGETFTVGSSIYGATGNYTDTFIAANGCDSVVHTSLTVYPVRDTMLTGSICPGEDFIVAGSVYSAAGIYYDTLQTSFGCDSIIQTVLTVRDTQMQQMIRVICAGDNVVVGSYVHTISGTFYDTLTNQNNCDSIVALNLIVLPDYITILNPTICIGDTFVVGTSLYTTSGSYNDTLVASVNCDSIVHTTLVVLNNVVTQQSISICAGENFIVGSSVYSTAGVYNDTFPASNGCDSIVETSLTVLPVMDSTLNVSICAGEVFAVGGSSYNTAGNYVDTLQSSLGCDSIVHAVITVHGTHGQAQNRVICSGDSISVGTSVYNTSGIYLDTFANSNNCDSIIQTGLIVLPDFITVLNSTICDGDTFFVGSSAYTVSGTYYDTLTASVNCDSIVNTILIVLNNSFTQLNPVICAGESFAVGNLVYNVAGTYSDTFPASNGCDSIVETVLTVLQVKDTTLNVSICNGETFTVGSAVYSIAGSYVDTLQSSIGCDSIIQTNLVLRNTHVQTQNHVICPDDSIVIGTSVYAFAGVYLDTLVNIHGCDSIIETHLTVLPDYLTTLNVTICSGDSFVIGASVYKTVGSYYDTLIASTGCDSVVNTTITLLNHLFTNLDTAVCFGESVTIGSSLYNADGNYTDTFAAANGCDSIVFTSLTILPVKDTTLNVSVCTGDAFTVGSSVYTTAGSYFDTLQSSIGCDSIIQTNLTLRSTHAQTQNHIICPDDSVVVGSSVYSSTGNYLDTLVNSNGCDSIIETHLTVLPDYLTTLNVTICSGDSFVIGISVYSVSGSYRDTLAANNGCDSVVNTTITVLNHSFTNLDTAVCFGESITIGSSIYNTDGNYTDTFVAANGCDSIVFTTLTILPVKDTTLNISICDGESFAVGGSAYMIAGNYIDTLQSSLGCDSVVHTSLTFRNTHFQMQNHVICSGDSIVIGSSSYTTTGHYFDTLVNSNACDSVIETHLIVLPDYITVLNAAICNGDSFIVGSSVYKAAGTYHDTLVASVNCDSIVRTTVTVLNVPLTHINTAICFGESFSIGSSAYNVAGNYTDTFTAGNGCDSIVHTSLSILPVRDTMLTISICSGENFTVGNSVYTITGNYIDTLQSSFGCDSIVETYLTVNTSDFQAQNVTVCPGGSAVVGMSIYTQAGLYHDTLINAAGCDSIIQTQLIILPNNITTSNITLCSGESYVNGSSTYNAAGSYQDTFISDFGCDSVVISVIQVLDTVHTFIDTALCSGEGLVVGSSYYNVAGTYADTLTAFNGCDSIIHLSLNILPIKDTTLGISICSGEVLVVGSSAYAVTGNYIDTVQSSFGCDSIVHTHLQVLPMFSTSVDSLICFGNTVSVGTSNYNTGGIYIDTLTAANGCDSIVTLNLTVHMPEETFISTTICNGDTFHAGNSAYYQSGVYVDSLLDRFGCDSVIESSVTILPLNYQVINSVLCEGETLFVANSSYTTNGTYFDTLTDSRGCDSIIESRVQFLLKSYRTLSAVICNGEQFTVGNSVYTLAGTYLDTFTAVNGCDSVVTTQLTVNPTKFTTIDTSLCMNQTLRVGTSIYRNTGIYYDTLLTTHGCDSVIRTQLHVFPIIHGAHDRFVCRGESIQFQLSGGVQYSWLPTTALSCTNCPNPVANPTQDITYSVRVTDANGCVGSDLIRVEVGYIEASIAPFDSITCEQDVVQFAGSVISDNSSISWYWNFDDGYYSTHQNPVHAYLDSGTFRVELFASNANGCSATDSATIAIKSTPQLTLSNDTAICFGDSAHLKISGAASYTWSPAVYLDNAHAASTVANPPSTIEYQVTGISAFGCMNFANVKITVHPLPVAEVSPDVAICPYSQAQLTASGGTSYRWFPPTGLSESSPHDVIASPQQSITYFVEATNDFGCKAMDSVHVEVHPETELRLSGSGDLCLGEEMPLSVEGAERYTWYPPVGLSCDTCENPIAMPNSNMVYQVQATDVYGCVYNDSVAIAVRANPEVNTINDVTICKGETIRLLTNISSAATHSWSPARFLDNVTNISPVSTPEYSTTYVVSVASDYGCTKTDTVNINIIEEVNASLDGDDGVCIGESARIEVEIEEASANGYSVVWSPAFLFGGQNTSKPVITPQDDVQITAVIYSQTCKADTVTFPIEVYDLPEVNAGADKTVYAGEEIRLSASSDNRIAEYQWTSPEGLDCPDCRGTNWTADGSRQFVVNVLDENGCNASDTVMYRVMGGCKEDIFVPNAFSPNGDEVNDKLLIRATNTIRLDYFRIFDRWGAQVYSSTDARESWDGRHPSGWNGFYGNNLKDPQDDVVPGVYVYMLKAGCRNGQQVILNGNITLIK